MRKRIFLVVAAVSVAMVSCSKDDDGAGGSGSGCTCTSTLEGADESVYTASEMNGKTCSELEDEMNKQANSVYTVTCK
ncbi:MAG: hypothetical protein R3Y16_04015 [Rikenellaceae bacterium]